MRTPLVPLAIVLLTGFTTGLQAQILDQSQLNYNSGISARTLPGYSIFQSFTAGITGTLVEVDMGVFNTLSGTGTLKIYQGVDTTGIVLQNTQVTINCPGGSCFAAFPTSAQVIAGQVYTFHFTPGNGIPDPYGVQAEVPGTYPGGHFGLIDPSGVYYPGFDLVFRTYVTASTGMEMQGASRSSIRIFPNPAHSTTTFQADRLMSDATISIENSSGKTVKVLDDVQGISVILSVEELPAGLYFVRLQEKQLPATVVKLSVSE